MKQSLFSLLAFFAPLLCTATYLIFLLIANLSMSQILESIGAIVEGVRPVSITNTDHLVNIAQRRALKKMRQHQSIEKLTKLMENPWSKPLIITKLVKRNKVWIYRIIVKVASFLIIFENLPNVWAHYEGDEIGN